ncbi:MAG: signal recognition particle-docking protein FtsY [Alphaproteobacteria bacterium CG_4_10_14_0_2_um_filter_63_37]|nr:MAG: signal recognition particle-docking protein FtsY [Alphaproteobacteria bacterium CG_4_10_14_0_2_um_filter_63_37]
MGLWSKLKSGLTKTRAQLGGGLGRLIGRKPVDASILNDLEDHLIMADMGVATVERLMEKVRRAAKKDPTPEAVSRVLRQELIAILKPLERPFLQERHHRPHVAMMVGINGAGKTTTLGKLARRYQGEGLKVMLAAGDTFRAAATEQLVVWGERAGVPVIRQGQGADSAAVAFDALESAQKRGIELLLIDTAGRLHTQGGLMEELKKVGRVLKRLDPEAPHDTLLVLDATIGQNALRQARAFHEATPVTGLVVTKLDGTAKGGVVVSIAEELKIPIAFIGVGEGVEDLRPFDAEGYVEALFSDD